MTVVARCRDCGTVISGVFSLTRQAVLLGYAPRVSIIHTSSREIGQIYIPGANWALMLATVALVFSFKSSSNLAAAYGVAVTTTMIITTILAYFVARYIWHWSRALALLVTVLFLSVDLAFFGANMVKVSHGGWFPLLMGAVVFTLFTTWKKGRELLYYRLQQGMLSLNDFVADVRANGIHRVPGIAVFLNSDSRSTPTALLHNIKHNRVLHEANIMVTVVTEEVPYVNEKDRMEFEDLGSGFYRVVLHYGFLEDPDVPRALRRLRSRGLEIDPAAATYIVSHNTLARATDPAMPAWRQKLFVFLSRNASRPTEFFHIPPNRVIELGMQVEI